MSNIKIPRSALKIPTAVETHVEIRILLQALQGNADYDRLPRGDLSSRTPYPSIFLLFSELERLSPKVS